MVILVILYHLFYSALFYYFLCINLERIDFVPCQQFSTLHFRGVYERSMTPPVVAHYIIWQPKWQRTEERGSPGFLHRSQRNTNIIQLNIAGELGKAPPRLRKFTTCTITATNLTVYQSISYIERRKGSFYIYVSSVKLTSIA